MQIIILPDVAELLLLLLRSEDTAFAERHL